MSTILLRTISAIEDKRIVLSNSQFARVIPIGTNWTRIRVGIRYSIRDTGANVISTPRFFVGMCSGTTNLFGDLTTDHAVGVFTVEATWTRGTVPTRYSLGNNPSWNCVKRVGTTNTTAGTGVGGTHILADPASGGRGLQFVDLTKGSPNFTIGVFQRTNFAGGIDASLNDFLTQMEIATPVLTDHTFLNTATLAVDEGANGNLNAAHVYWDRTTPEIEISDLAVARLA